MNKLLNRLPKPLAKAIAKGGHVLKKNAPDIFIVIGVGLVIGATIEACKRSPKAKDILEEHNEKRETLGERTKENSKEIGTLYKETSVELTKTYAVPAAVMGAGLAFIFYSHNILKQRNAALLSAYASLDAAFKAYREKMSGNLKDICSEENPKDPSEHRFVNGIEVDENGFPIGAVSGDPNAFSPYSFIFGPSSSEWCNNGEYNYNTLMGIQNMSQRKYDNIGFLFWNDILTAAGQKPTPAGAVMGWVKGLSDDYIDLGVKKPDEVECADWIPKFERPYIVSPNLKDVIWDKI